MSASTSQNAPVRLPLPLLLQYIPAPCITYHLSLLLSPPADYLGDVDDAAATMDIAFKLYLAHKQYTDALRLALRLGGAKAHGRVKAVFDACGDAGVRRQMGYMLGRHRFASFIARDDGAS